jgi:ketosteroid isomerase-like protein
LRTRNLIWGLLASLMMVSGAAAQTATTGTAEQAVTAAEYQWLKSAATNNVDLLVPLLADKVVETTGDAQLLAGKDAVLADAKSVTWSSVDYKEFKVTVFGHAAIVTGIFIGKGKDAAGKPVDERARFTDTWIQMADGKWLLVADHDSLLKN